ncbi:MAG: hypothetical protein EOM03_16500 [Clostridia bacterium]|nr:hypothetical protein [Clostridia bacterium]
MAKKEALMVSDAAALKEGMQAWLEAKEREQLAIDERREIEDYLTNAMFALSEDFEGSQSLTLDDYKLTVTGRMNRKVDADRVQELAREHGLTAAIEDLFSWKADVRMTEWRQADPAITGLFSEAITTTPGRPSYKITVKEGK